MFSDQSLLELDEYIEEELKFKDFKLEQRDDTGVRLVLK